MSIAEKFMEIARMKLSKQDYDSILSQAIELDMIDVMRPAQELKPVHNPNVAARINAHFKGEEFKAVAPAHVETQIKKRIDLDITPADLGELAELLRQNHPSNKLRKQHMRLIQEVEVTWRGKVFIVVWDKSTSHLITAYPNRSREVKKSRSMRPKEWRVSQNDDHLGQ